MNRIMNKTVNYKLEPSHTSFENKLPSKGSCVPILINNKADKILHQSKSNIYISPIKKNTVMCHLQHQDATRIFIIIKVSQRKRQIPYDVTYMWNLQ